MLGAEGNPLGGAGCGAPRRRSDAALNRLFIVMDDVQEAPFEPPVLGALLFRFRETSNVHLISVLIVGIVSGLLGSNALR